MVEVAGSLAPRSAGNTAGIFTRQSKPVFPQGLVLFSGMKACSCLIESVPMNGPGLSGAIRVNPGESDRIQVEKKGGRSFGRDWGAGNEPWRLGHIHAVWRSLLVVRALARGVGRGSACEAPPPHALKRRTTNPEGARHFDAMRRRQWVCFFAVVANLGVFSIDFS